MRVFVQLPRSPSSASRPFFQAECLPKPIRTASVPPAEPPEEVTVRGRKTMTQFRLEIERARDDVFRRFNEANEGSGTDIKM